MQNLIQQISTHKAIKTKNGINIVLKGFTVGDYSCKDELLYTISHSEIDDVDSIMDRYDEDNRVNISEFINN